jgi:hypothetical protein
VSRLYKRVVFRSMKDFCDPDQQTRKDVAVWLLANNDFSEICIKAELNPNAMRKLFISMAEEENLSARRRIAIDAIGLLQKEKPRPERPGPGFNIKENYEESRMRSQEPRHG